MSQRGPLTKAPIPAIDLAKVLNSTSTPSTTPKWAAVTASLGTHRTEAVGVVHQQAEPELLLEGHDLVQLPQVAFHAEHALGNDEHAAVLRLGQLGGMAQLEAQRLHVVVAEHETLALVHAQAVDDAGVGLGVVHHHVARREQAVDDRNHALVAEVEQEGILLAHELGQLALQLLVVFGLATHHAGTHGGRHAEFGRTVGIGLAHLGVVGQAEVVVQTPVQHLLAAERHVGTDLAFEFRESEVAVGIRHVLTDGAARVLLKTFENINHSYVILNECSVRFHKLGNFAL